jgi:hypothetical protein
MKKLYPELMLFPLKCFPKPSCQWSTNIKYNKRNTINMVSASSFYKAFVNVFGIFSFYGYVLLAIIQSMFFVFTIIVGLSFYSYILWIVPFMPFEVGYKVIFLEFWRVLGFGLVWGIIGLIYLVKNQKRYRAVLFNSEKPTKEELERSIFYAIITLALLGINVALTI